ncbi:MAG: SDR family oxidoreductase [Pseudomonadota bacterium]
MAKSKSVVVTGVSTGIGRAIAKRLIAHNWKVFGSVRKEQDAADVSEELGSSFTPLLFDVTDEAAIAQGVEQVAQALDGRPLGGLVNNAGIAVTGPAQHIPLSEVQWQFEVNVFGPLRVSQAFLPLLGARRDFKGTPGKIVNMSSVAGKMASPFMSPYAMSKHALEALSDAMRRELKLYGVDVVIVGPGAIKTPIWEKADDINVDQYRDTDYGIFLQGMKDMMQEYGNEGLPADDVGELVADILEGRAKKTRYAILKNKFMMWTVPQLLPTRMVDNAIAKRFGLRKIK